MGTLPQALFFLRKMALIFFDMSSASGYMGAKCFQELGPRILACHVPNEQETWVTALGTLEKEPLGCGHSLHTVGFQSPRWAFKTCSGLPKIWGPFF